MLKLTVQEKKILDALLTAEPKTVAGKLGVSIQTVYNTKNYFRRKVQNAEEFLAVAKSKYKPLLGRRLNTPRIVPIEDEI
jgi:transposase